MTTLGEYAYANYSIVNFVDAHDDGLESTHLHEIVHLILTQSTGYGFFSTIIDRVVKFDPEYEYLNTLLLKHMLGLQEGISTFFELIRFVERESLEKAPKFIRRLKLTRKKYYNYMHPHLLRLLKFTDMPKDGEANFSPKDLLDIVYRLAFVAMSCDLTAIPMEKMCSKKNLKKYIQQEHPTRYLPNRRFRVLLSELNKVLLSIDDQVYDKVAILKESLRPIENRDFYLKFFLGDENREQYFSTRADNTKTYIKNIFSESRLSEIIYTTIDTFNTKAVDIERIHHHVVPSSYREVYNGEKTDDEIILKYAKDGRDLGIFFIAMDSSFKENINNARAYIPKKFFEEVGGAYPDHLFLLYMSCCQQKTFSSMFPKSKLDLMFAQNIKPIVVNYKLKTLIDELAQSPLEKIYVYCDRPYSSATKTIKEYATTTKKARLVEYGDMCILVIRISDKVDFFLPIISSLRADVESDIISGFLNLTLDFDLEIWLHDYDPIVNSLFGLPCKLLEKDKNNQGSGE